MNMSMDKVKEVALRVAKFVWRKSVEGILAGWLIALVFFIALQFEPEKFMRFVTFLQQPGTMWDLYWGIMNDVVFCVPIFVVCKILFTLFNGAEKKEV